jgi:hypothetical protein
MYQSNSTYQTTFLYQDPGLFIFKIKIC